MCPVTGIATAIAGRAGVMDREVIIAGIGETINGTMTMIVAGIADPARQSAIEILCQVTEQRPHSGQGKALCFRQGGKSGSRAVTGAQVKKKFLIAMCASQQT